MSTPHLAIPAVPPDQKDALETTNLRYAHEQVTEAIRQLQKAFVATDSDFLYSDQYVELGQCLQSAANAIWQANVGYQLAALINKADGEDVIMPPTEADDAQLLRDPKADEIGGAA